MPNEHQILPELSDELSRWLPLSQSAGAAPKLQLICFPHAGAGSSAYSGWPAALPDTIELRALRLPGREIRWNEQSFTNMTALVRKLAALLRPLTSTPYALFGHSMGALISFELARQFRRERLPAPAHLFLSGARAPHIEDRESPLHRVPDGVFLAELTRRLRRPDIALTNLELAKVLLPILRADFTLCETYHPVPEPPLEIPMSVYGGRRDDRVTYSDLVSWSLYTTRSFKLQLFPGDHFFLKENRDAFLSVLAEDLTAVSKRVMGNARL